MKPMISVIIPVYNVEEYLDECIKSVVNQTYENLEIILVDDGSPDRCGGMCDEWAKKDARIKVIHKKNGGLSDARNVALDVFKGEYVAFVDSDDWIDDRFYETLYDDITQNDADIAMIGVWKVTETSKENITANLKERTFTGKEALHDFLYFKNNLGGGTWDKLFKRELFETLRFPTGLNAEDRYTHAVLYSKIKKLYLDPKPLYYYRVREDSICTSDINEHTFDRIEIMKKVCDYFESIGYSDEKAINYFKMKAYDDVLYKLLTINADKKYIKEYKKHLRSYWAVTMKNSEVSTAYKVKNTFRCTIPVLYEKVKGGIR